MDERSFGDKSLACAHRLHRIAYLILGNEADCEDAMQEALLRAWRHRDGLRETGYFETWLIRILINESKAILRRRSRQPEAELLDAHAAPEPRDPGLRDAIQALDVKYRVPLILHHMEGYRQEEIASMLWLPVSTVKWRLRQARKLLRVDLEEEGGAQ